MLRSFKNFALLTVLTCGIPALSQANDISSYAAPYNPRNSDTYFFRLFNQQNDVWTRIRKGFGIADLDNNNVERNTAWYAARPDYLERSSERASKYIYHVVEELEKRDMPTELALLPFVESAFNPQALSSARAAGMWQFIPSTGLHYNLKQNLFTDERRDVLASTDAALNYLQKLYQQFGDWQLALAAYNWGEGALQRAIKRNKAEGKPTDYESLYPLMPKETQNYIPKLQAIKNIISEPDTYDIALPTVKNQPYFAIIDKTQNIDIKVAAELAELPLDEFKALNPQFNRPVIIGSKETQILLPAANAEKFKQNLALRGNTDSLTSWAVYTVQSKSSSVEAIAKKFGTTEQLLRSVNHIPPKMVLKAGSTILVPATDDDIAGMKEITPEVANTARIAFAPAGPETKIIRVKVKRKESITALAKRYKVSTMQIRQWNNMKSTELNAGQVLELHVPVVKRKKVSSKT